MSRPVLITTEYKGVFFGYAEDTSGDNVVLTSCRNCIYWPSTQGGFLGLASIGPVTTRTKHVSTYFLDSPSPELLKLPCNFVFHSFFPQIKSAKSQKSSA